MPVIAAAATACVDMVAAKGWVASMSASTGSLRRKPTKPSTPPNPPIRTRPGGRAGSRTRPARVVITSTPPATR